MKHFGTILKHILIAKGISQKSLADKMGVSRAYISALCRQSDCTCSKLEDICREIHVSPMLFFDDIKTDGTGLSPETFVSPRPDDSHLDALLELKDQQISLLEQRVRSLEEQLRTQNRLLESQSGQITSLLDRRRAAPTAPEESTPPTPSEADIRAATDKIGTEFELPNMSTHHLTSHDNVSKNLTNKAPEDPK